MSIQYVVGFLFNEDRDLVVLIQRLSPFSDVKRRWNGVGGKIGDGEAPAEAMVREFREETGLIVPQDQWAHCITLHNEHFECQVFRAFAHNVDHVETKGQDQVSVWDFQALQECPLVDHVEWIIPLLLDEHLDFGDVVQIKVR